MDFAIVDDQFFAFTDTSKTPSRILLVERSKTTRTWAPSSVPYFYLLRTFIADELNKVQKKLKLPTTDFSDINEDLLLHMKLCLRSLLLEKFK